MKSASASDSELLNKEDTDDTTEDSTVAGGGADRPLLGSLFWEGFLLGFVVDAAAVVFLVTAALAAPYACKEPDEATDESNV